MRSLLPWFFIVSGSFLLTACGGSGGDGGGNTPANRTPFAIAGDDQSVSDGELVTLDGSASNDADSDPLNFTWMQTAGPDVTLAGGATAMPSFTAPSIPGGTSLTFELTVSDGVETASDSMIVTVNDTTAASVEIAPVGKILGKTEPIVIAFSEAMDTASLAIEGDFADAVTTSWSADGKTLTLVSNAAGNRWRSGSNRELDASVRDTAGNVTDIAASWLIKLVFSYQAADYVIGKASLTAIDNPLGITERSVSSPYGTVHYADGWLYVTDYARILGFDSLPEQDNAAASLLVGQATFNDNANPTETNGNSFEATDVFVADGQLFIVDGEGNRVLIYNSIPTMPPGTADVIVGAPNATTRIEQCGSRTFDYPIAVFVIDGKLLVSDNGGHRVLIWNSIPQTSGQAADIVLGQVDLDSCTTNGTGAATAQTLRTPEGIWSDGERLVVADTGNHRVLIWNTFPTANGQAADIVVGQSVFSNTAFNDDDSSGVQDGASSPTPTARVFERPAGVFANADQLFVADGQNHRVLIWNTFPTENFQPADVVLGQIDMTKGTFNDINTNGMIDDDGVNGAVFRSPAGVVAVNDTLIVTDSGNDRYLIFKSQ